MIINKRTLIVFCSIILSSSAHAIPPPDVVISLWQSILQMIGMLSVFAAGAYYSIKQFFGYTLSTWKRPLFTLIIFLGTIGIGYGSYAHFLNNNAIKTTTSEPSIPKPPSTNQQPNSPDGTLIQGEQLTIDEVLDQEPDVYARNWKKDTFKEMLEETDFVRNKAKLPKFSYQTITSFTPKALQKQIETNPDKLFMLDVRGAYEQKMFYLPYQATAHYGDLLNDVLRQSLKEKLPRDKRIVILCHSGLRGYFAANLLLKHGYSNVSFLQGGLANWNQQKLPIKGDENYSLSLALYPVFSEKEAREKTGLQKIEIDPGAGFVDDIEGLIEISYETSTTEALGTFIEESKSKPILMVCRGYGGCFHTLNFGYLIEKSGGKVAGVFDRTGQFIIPPIIE